MAYGRVAAALLLPLLFNAPTARAECSKSTVMRPCRKSAVQHAGVVSRKTQTFGYRRELRSPGLVVGGLGVALVGTVVGLGSVLVSTLRCGREYEEPKPCPHSEVFAGLGVLTIIGSLGGGGYMMYYGALTKTRPAPPPVSLTPWASPSAQGMSIAVRF